MRHRVTALTFAAALVFVLAGCGHDTISKQEFIRRGDQACKEATKQLNEVLDTAKSASSREEIVGVMRRAHKISVNLRNRFDALPVPAGDEAKVKRIISLQRTMNDAEQQAIDAYAKGDDAALDAAPRRFANANRGELRLLREYGFRVCPNVSDADFR